MVSCPDTDIDPETSLLNSLCWQIYIINSVYKTTLSLNLRSEFVIHNYFREFLSYDSLGKCSVIFRDHAGTPLIAQRC